MIIRTSVMSEIDRNTVHHTQCPWNGLIDGIQGGSDGIVFGREPGSSYRTAFVEVWGDIAGFVRGEGKDIAAAERSAWDKVQRIISCLKHEYEPRGYTNGAGFCKHCNHFAIKCFSAEDLGLLCYVCQTPSFDTCKHGSVCDEHHPGREYTPLIKELSDKEILTPEEEDELFSLYGKYFAAAREG